MVNPDDSVNILGKLGKKQNKFLLKIQVPRMLHSKIDSLLDIPLQVTLNKVKFLKSVQQLRWLFGAAYVVIQRFLSETQGKSYTREQIHSYCTQWVLNEGNTGKSVVFTETEFEIFLEDYTKILESKGEKVARNVAHKFAKKLECNVQVRDVLGKRVVTVEELERISKVSKKRFNEYKEELQKYWGKRGCDIPDPISKEDYIEQTTKLIDE